MSIGILGGTFNPIHNGHLILAQEMLNALHFSKVLFIPAKTPPLKNITTSEEDRYNMVQLAIADNPLFEVSRIELDRSGVSYTIDTIKELKQQIKDDFYFIIGSDNVLDITHWHDWKELVSICNFAIAARPGINANVLDVMKSNLGNELIEQWQKNFVPIYGLQISSTEIRNRLQNNIPVKYYLPESVIDYIQKHQLYKIH